MMAQAELERGERTIRALSKRAYSLGFGEGKVAEAMQCYEQAENVGREAVALVKNDTSRSLLVHALIDKADFQIGILAMHESGADTLMRALDLLEDFDEKDMKQKIIVADAYRALTTSEIYSSYVARRSSEWESKGHDFLIRAFVTSPDNLKLDDETFSKFLFLQVTFWSYEARSRLYHDPPADVVWTCTQAIEHLEGICSSEPTENKFKHQLTTALLCRASAYQKYGAQNLETRIHCSEKDIMQALGLAERPYEDGSVYTAVNSIELSHVYVGLADHLACFSINGIVDALQKAETFIANFVAMVPCNHWQWYRHCTTLLKLASYSLDSDEKITLLSRAADSASEAMAQSDKFLYIYFDELMKALDSMVMLSFDLKCRSWQASARRKLKNVLKSLTTMREECPWHFYIQSAQASVHLALAKFYKRRRGCASNEGLHLRSYLHIEGKLYGTKFTPRIAKGENYVKKAVRDALWEAVHKVPKTTKHDILCWNLQTRVPAWCPLHICHVQAKRDILSDQQRTLKYYANLEIPIYFRIAVRRLQALRIKNDDDFFVQLMEHLSYQVDICKVGDKITTTDCCICMESIDSQENHYMRCGHCFHSNCILDWSEHHEDCPICRQSLI